MPMVKRKTQKKVVPATQSKNEAGDISNSMEINVGLEKIDIQMEKTQESGNPLLELKVPVSKSAPVILETTEVIETEEIMVPIEKPKNWNSLFTDNRSRSMNSELKYIPPAINAGDRIVQFNSKDVEKEEYKWKNALIGCVYGLYPKFEIISAFVKNRWRNEGLQKVVRVNASMFMFKFDNEDQCNKILGSGPFTFDQRPMLLKKWHPRMVMDPSVITSIPIWIQLPGLPWEFWTPEMLSKIGSICGLPLYCDQCTVYRTKLSFARVLVEMDITGVFPENVFLQDENGNRFCQRIDYEWRPIKCTKCNRLGHSTGSCKVVQRKTEKENVNPVPNEKEVLPKEPDEQEEAIIDQIVVRETGPQKKDKSPIQVSLNPFGNLNYDSVVKPVVSVNKTIGVIGEGRKGRNPAKPPNIAKC